MSAKLKLGEAGKRPLSELTGNMTFGEGSSSRAVFGTDRNGKPKFAVVLIRGEDTQKYLDAIDAVETTLVSPL